MPVIFSLVSRALSWTPWKRIPLGNFSSLCLGLCLWIVWYNVIHRCTHTFIFFFFGRGHSNWAHNQLDFNIVHYPIETSLWNSSCKMLPYESPFQFIYMGVKILGKPYAIKLRCYWEHLEGTTWELGEPHGNIIRTIALDYPIGSNFWKFYLIRTSFTLNELVSLVKVFRLFRLERIFLVSRVLNAVGRCTTSYLLAGPACLWCLVVLVLVSSLQCFSSS
jgi:hypothetical protein